MTSAQAMLAWLRVHDPSAPIWYGYASVLRDFRAATESGPGKGVLGLHFRVANLDPAFQGVDTWNQAAPGLPVRASPPPRPYEQSWRPPTALSGAWQGK